LSERVFDLNADLGESFGLYRYGVDDELMPFITSANVACGFHAGDPATLRAAVRSACASGVRVGAHVGLPDRLGFGRREISISPQDAYDYTLYQLGALDAFVRTEGSRMTHIKPHGALYMMASRDGVLADAIVTAAKDFDPALEVYALPGSALEAAAIDRGLPAVPEFFADRPYQGTEVQMFGWTYEQIGGPADVARRVRAMAESPDFAQIKTICVHSDTRGAVDLLRAVRGALAADVGNVVACGR
jgi:UPF0271 protein